MALRYQLATKIIRFNTIKVYLWGYAKDRVYADKPSTLENFKTNIRQVMAGISVQYVSKGGGSQKNQCSQHFSWRSFKWCSVSHITSTFKLYNNQERNITKKIFCMSSIYIYFWKHGMDNPIWKKTWKLLQIKCITRMILCFL